ncbi:MAG: glycoside hydrolase family 2 TIM barrel-domain containing protein [Bacteroidota bacterium]
MKLNTTLAFIVLFALSACNNKMEKTGENWTPAHVEMKDMEGKYRLYVNNQEFYIKGAGCEGGDIKALAGHGGNTFRTWRVDNSKQTGEQVLDLARENGLMVVMGLNVALERHGFDYNDTVKVREQYERLVKQVDKYKNHPALLAWGIGNELNLRSTNPKVWRAVNDIANYIHKNDGNHPTTTMLSGISKTDVDYIKEYCPEIDFISVQMYADVVNLSTRLKDAGYKKPYLVSEWGATGHWEVGQTSWNAPIEQSSSEKADAIKYRYENVILKDDSLCMGSFVFLWGQKQERTPTWYGLFSESGEETEAIDVLHYYWTGSWPENRAPRFHNATFNEKGRNNNITTIPGEPCICKCLVSDPDEDDISYKIEVLEESSDKREGGDIESRPQAIIIKDLTFTQDGFEFKAPDVPGAYRLFIYASDGNNHVATFNFPFFVK